MVRRLALASVLLFTFASSADPQRGQWQRGFGGTSPDLGIVAVHAALMRHGDDAQVLFFSPPRTRREGGGFETAPAEEGGGFHWNLSGLGDVEVKLLDLQSGTLLDRPMEAGEAGTDRRNLFCSGHAHTADGRLFLAGGHVSMAAGGKPSRRTVLRHDASFLHVFNPSPSQPSWRRLLRPMAWSRWYPTVTALADGRMLITSGNGAALTGGPLDEAPFGWRHAARKSYEIYDPATDRLLPLARGTGTFVNDPDLATYPAVFVLPGGAVLAVERNRGHLFGYHSGPSPRLEKARTYFLSSKGSRSFPFYGSSVLLPLTAEGRGPVRVLVTGGQNEEKTSSFDYDLDQLATASAEVFELEPGAPLTSQRGFRSLAPLGERRFLHDATLLADGTVLISGGARRGFSNRNREPVLGAEIFDPLRETFEPAAVAPTERRYHSTALLLPDGSVLKAGSTGGFDSDQRWIMPQFSADRFLPPYLFRGPRPEVIELRGTGPSPDRRVSYGGLLGLTVRGEALSTPRAALVRLGSVTHGNDMDQRFVWLPVFAAVRGEAGRAQFEVRLPRDGSVAPPGDYMLFVLNDRGVPSMAKFLRLVSSADAQTVQ